jgi:hypothetical protein
MNDDIPEQRGSGQRAWRWTVHVGLCGPRGFGAPFPALSGWKRTATSGDQCGGCGEFHATTVSGQAEAELEVCHQLAAKWEPGPERRQVGGLADLLREAISTRKEGNHAGKSEKHTEWW